MVDQAVSRSGRHSMRGLALGAALAVLAVALVWALGTRQHAPAPLRGVAAAEWLETDGQGGADSITHARCTQSACTVWFKPIASGSPMTRRTMYRALAGDVAVLGKASAVVPRSWRFVLTTANARLTAACSYAQAATVGGVITPQVLGRHCQTSWHPTG